MHVPCPNCSASVAVPEELLTRGVSRIHCPQCNFGFVMRLGDPNAKKANKTQERDPLAPVEIEGVTSSGSTTETAGEIGQGRGQSFIPTQTRSSIKLSPELLAMIAEDEARLQKEANRGVSEESREPPEAGAPIATQDVSVADTKEEHTSLPAPLPPPPEPGVKQLAVLSIPTALDATETTSSPAPQAPQAQAPAPQAPQAQAPAPQAPQAQAPAPQAPQAQAPAPQAPQAQAPAPQAPQAQAPAPQAPQAQAPAPQAPQAAGTAPWPVAPSLPKATQSPQSAGTTPWPVASSPVPQTPASPGSQTPASSASSPPTTPTAVGPQDEASGFESFSAIDAAPAGAPAPPPGVASASAPPVALAPAPVGVAPVSPPLSAPSPSPAVTPQVPNHLEPAVYDPSLDLYGYGLDTPREGPFVRLVGFLMLLTITGALLFGVFVLYRNDWSVDFSNLDHMLDRALGNPDPPTSRGIIDTLQISRPTLGVAELAGDKQVATATGIIHNMGTQAARYIYVIAHLKQGGRIVASSKAPAGNSFTPKDLASLDEDGLAARINPAGTNGRNAKVAPGKSVAYMVVFTNLPADFSLDTYTVDAKITAAERFPGS